LASSRVTVGQSSVVSLLQRRQFLSEVSFSGFDIFGVQMPVTHPSASDESHNLVLQFGEDLVISNILEFLLWAQSWLVLYL
jgi:hypothetical protein